MSAFTLCSQKAYFS